MGRFIIKHIDNRKPQMKVHAIKENVAENKNSEMIENKKVENNEKKINEVMTTSEKIEMVNNVLASGKPAAHIKRVKKDKGLIERTESSKTILTEDNKELLND